MAPPDSGFAVFAALADPTRRHVLEVLVGLHHASATHLAAHLPVSRQAVIKHLRVLESAGLVSGRRTGPEVIYVARVGTLRATARWLLELCETWRTREGQLRTSPDIPSLTADSRADESDRPVRTVAEKMPRPDDGRIGKRVQDGPTTRGPAPRHAGDLLGTAERCPTAIP